MAYTSQQVGLESIPDAKRAVLRTTNLRAFCVTVAILGGIPALCAQTSNAPGPAPVPAQISAAHKVFVSNAGGESFEAVIDQTVFHGGGGGRS
jgi:hypothetical protein